MPTAEVEQAIFSDITDFIYDPQGFAMYAYPWGRGELADSAGPRKWQSDVNRLIATHLQDSTTRHIPLCVAVASGHGIGKSAEIGMLIHWGMSTCEDCKVVVTANTGTQLSTKTVPEAHKWIRLGINSHWFDAKATSITVRDPGHEKTWRTDFIPWSEYNTEAFAGCHNKGKRIILIYDEASGIAAPVWEVSEGALTDENTEIIFLAFGNPTQNTGRFRDCFGRFGHRWKTFQIDSRNVEGTNKEQIEKWIADYGEDSDFVRVRVRGEFPRAGSNQFIAGDLVAQARCAIVTPNGPSIMAVDAARFGDDRSVVGIRKGRSFRILATYRGIDTAMLGEHIIEFLGKESPDATVIDGDGIGAGVVDHLKFRGFTDRIFEFHGAGEPKDSKMYFNKRAECWGLMRDWLSTGQIPDLPEIDQDLTGPEYGFSRDGQIQLERKEDMKKRGLASPDYGDTLAMTFAVTVLQKQKANGAPPPKVGVWS